MNTEELKYFAIFIVPAMLIMVIIFPKNRKKALLVGGLFFAVVIILYPAIGLILNNILP